MNREIKFRAWDIKGKRWLVDFVIKTNGAVEVGFGDLNGYRYAPRDVELCQYTGLKDKNGKEIYEGDIVKRFEMDDKPEQVTWNDFNCRTWNERDLEVIGNIYENPELL